MNATGSVAEARVGEGRPDPVDRGDAAAPVVGQGELEGALGRGLLRPAEEVREREAAGRDEGGLDLGDRGRLVVGVIAVDMIRAREGEDALGREGPEAATGDEGEAVAEPAWGMRMRPSSGEPTESFAR